MLQQRTAHAFFLALAACLFLSGHTARAQDKQERLKAYDTHGLDQDARPYALKPEIGLDMTHARARQFIALLPENYQSAPLRNLVISTLLARIDGASITKRGTLAEGEDLLTVRLKALNTMGAYKHAFRLYAALESDIVHPQLLRAGIHTQLGLGRHALACLEAKAGLDSLNSHDAASIDPGASFWTQMQQFCAPVIGQPLFKGEDREETGESDTLIKWGKTSNRASAWTELKRYSAPQMAAIMRSHAAHLANLEGSPGDLPTPKLAMLAHISEAPLALKYELMKSTAARNLTTPGQWRKFLRDANTRMEDTESESESDRNKLPESLQHLLKLATQYSAKQRGESTPPAAETLETFAQAYDDAPAPAMLAFESLLNAPSQDTPGLRTRNIVMEIFLQANRYIKPGKWGIGSAPINDAAQAEPENQALTRQYQLLSLFALRDQEIGDSFTDYITACARKSTCTPPDYAFMQDLKAFSNGLNTGVANSITPATIYDNEKGLTFHSRYVIPSVSLRERIKEKNAKKGLGKAIFLSTLALHREENDKLEPYFTASVLKKLSDAGINRFGRDFAIAYLIGTLEKKE